MEVNVLIKEMKVPRTAPKIINFGKYRNVRITRVPHLFLRSLANQDPPFLLDGINWSEVAQKELDRRGTNINPILRIPVSEHAIDRFSEKHLDKWLDRTIGIASYLSILARTAWDIGKFAERGFVDNKVQIRKYYLGISFVFVCDNCGDPVKLITIS